RGQHLILFGERGVGKTSLATIILDIATRVGKQILGMVSVSVNCTPADSFEDVWTRVFRAIERNPDIDQTMGFDGPVSREDMVETLRALNSLEHFGAEEVRHVIQPLRPPFIILDEFDQLDAPHATMLMANTIKTFSDHGTGATLLLVGVGDS